MILGWTPSIPRYLGGKFESVPKRCKSGKASSSGKVGTNLRLIRSNQILTGAKASLGNFTAIWWGGGGGGIFVFHKLLQVRLLPGGQLSLQLITGWPLYQPYSHHIHLIHYNIYIYSVYHTLCSLCIVYIQCILIVLLYSIICNHTSYLSVAAVFGVSVKFVNRV